jgi:hypothetical protein
MWSATLVAMVGPVVAVTESVRTGSAMVLVGVSAAYRAWARSAAQSP